MEFLPKYIRQVVEKLQGQVVTAEEWNNLFNLLIQQGDNNTEGIVNVINNLSENYPTTQLVQNLITQYIKKIGAADMSTETYDTDKDGIVDQAATVNDGAITNKKIADGAVTEEKIQKDLIDLIKYLEQVVGILSIQNLLDIELEGSRDMYTFGWDEQAKVGYRLAPQNTTEYTCVPHAGRDLKKLHITNGTTTSSAIPTLTTALNLNQEYLLRDLRDKHNIKAIKLTKHNPEQFSLSGKVYRFAINTWASNDPNNILAEVIAYYGTRYLVRLGTQNIKYVLINIDDDLNITKLQTITPVYNGWTTNHYDPSGTTRPTTIYNFACRIFHDLSKAPTKCYVANGHYGAQMGLIVVDFEAGTMIQHTITTKWGTTSADWRFIDGCIKPDGNLYWNIWDYNSEEYDGYIRVFKNGTELWSSELLTDGPYACGVFKEHASGAITSKWCRWDTDDNEFYTSTSGYEIIINNIDNVSANKKKGMTFSASDTIRYDWRSGIHFMANSNETYMYKETEQQSKFIQYPYAYAPLISYPADPDYTIFKYPHTSFYMFSDFGYQRTYYMDASNSLTKADIYIHNLKLSYGTNLATLIYRPEGSTSSTSLTYKTSFIDPNRNILIASCVSGSASNWYAYLEANRFVIDNYETAEELPLWFTGYGFAESKFTINRLYPLLSIAADGEQAALINLRDTNKTYTNLNLILQLDRQLIEGDAIKVYYNVSADEEQFIEIPSLKESTEETLYYEVKFDEPKTVYSIKVVAKTGNQPLIIKKVLGGVDNEI